MMDDVGVADISYAASSAAASSTSGNTAPNKPAIPTPHIDALSRDGVRFLRHYAHPTCTPTRASLMTGRYSMNTGLTIAMLPGSVAGLPRGMPTLPSLLKQAGYRTHMVGKWHLGYSQWRQTPVGVGFESHVGNFLWDLDSYSKQTFSTPWRPVVIDWSRNYPNRTIHHFSDPRHATIAQTDEAQKVIIQHSKEHRAADGSFSSPLFLYLAFTAAHSPLQPHPSHTAACQHIPHLWRREFCGMVVGIDEAIHNLTKTITEHLGDNVVLVLSSDNGASPWFGGLSTPLRSGKTTPFEGGVRVPAFGVDFTHDRRYLGRPREFNGLIHMSDWLPTFVDIAGAPLDAKLRQDLDGVSLSECLSKEQDCPRTTVMVDMYYGTQNESVFTDEDVAAYIKGRFKLIWGDVRDDSYYYEPTTDALNYTGRTFGATLGEWLIRALEWVWGEGPFDTTRVSLTHLMLHGKFVKRNQFLLYDIFADPEEKNNLADRPEYAALIKEMKSEMLEFKAKRPRQTQYWKGYSSFDEWIKTFSIGDCSAQPPGVIHGECRFTHPFLEDDVDVEKLEETLPNLALRGQQYKRILADIVLNPFQFWVVWVITLTFVYFASNFFCWLLSFVF